MRAIRFHQYGGPEVLSFEEVATGSPKSKQLRIRQTAIGVNFIDTYHRTGLYPVKLPSGLGGEAAGVVVETGSRVTAFKTGDRVAYVDSSLGAYADERVIDASSAVRLPDSISEQQAAAMLLKGLTAWFLLRRCYRVRKNDPIVLHSATGGVGLITLQWATALGAKVIAVVGSDAKAALARWLAVMPRRRLHANTALRK
ncbi:MAG: NADPH:quinone reductase [Steroidobacteraceae bacterium]|nr:NADPH:quinone reductase [Steroidobacteraceae bacterium]